MKLFAAAALAVFALGPGGCHRPIERHASNARHTVVIGSKDFAEEFVLAQIYAQALHAAGYKVRLRLGVGDEQVAFRALKQGSIDAYPEYAGVILTSFYGYRLISVPTSGKVAGSQARYLLGRDGVTALPPAPANDTVTMVTTTARFGHTIASLRGKARGLTVGGYRGCASDEACLGAVERRYGIKFKRFRAVKDPYAALDNGRADVVFAFATDAALLQGAYYKQLRDDGRTFPSEHVMMLFRRRALRRLGPDARRVVAQVQERLTTARLRELNGHVQIDHRSPKRVAHEYLRRAGLVK